MKVFVNGKEVQLFSGATLKHALLKADDQYYHAVRRGKAAIKDQYGNTVEMNGSADDGFSYTVLFITE
ncbi:hypothetical protein SAMN05421736_116112 [Evansella caseinilytica]|uniref:Uncharacterized protein n=1 Tax=Evansella caseinilytica TaxID=1503961 RepID=A0A1H3TWP3_9BACI|nr:hypothetical protein [Evansella caseinilytica]SDZ54626.1 hypothetical protein SAMN05421736_116112 [Evansella caseinilytica]